MRTLLEVEKDIKLSGIFLRVVLYAAFISALTWLLCEISKLGV